MDYEVALNFVKSLLHNFHFTFMIVQNPLALPHSPADLGLRKLLKPDFDYSVVSKKYAEICRPNTIYRTKDFFLCYYLIFRIPPDEENNFATIGPYTCSIISKEVLVNTYGSYSFPPDIIAQLEKYYQEVPYVADDSYLHTLLYTLGEWMWGGVDNFSIQDLSEQSMDHLDPAGITWHEDDGPSADPFVSMKALENRYAAETELLKAVSLGQIHKAEIIMNQFSHRQMEQRTPDSLRNQKNYAVITNTLLRKAAQAADIHPLYLDRISTRYARAIELCISPEAVKKLQREMIHSYCQLVQDHSLKGFSPLIQKVITHIDADLTVDLSLYSLAKMLNVNASYLSSLFKKETGATLTEYVDKKRIRQAVLLLDSSNMQIQVIAQYCGIPDVNYFIRTFKKYIGKTPKEYRDLLRGK